MRAWLAAMTHPDGGPSFFNDAAFGIAASRADLEAYAARLGLGGGRRSRVKACITSQRRAMSGSIAATWPRSSISPLSGPTTFPATRTPTRCRSSCRWGASESSSTAAPRPMTPGALREVQRAHRVAQHRRDRRREFVRGVGQLSRGAARARPRCAHRGSGRVRSYPACARRLPASAGRTVHAARSWQFEAARFAVIDEVSRPHTSRPWPGFISGRGADVPESDGRWPERPAAERQRPRRQLVSQQRGAHRPLGLVSGVRDQRRGARASVVPLCGGAARHAL